MKKLQVAFLGSFQIILDDENITDRLRTKKERAIFAYLAEESARVHSRETIAEFFWADRPESYARMNLRQALLGIRKAFGGDEILSPFLTITENKIKFNAESVEIDTVNFYEYLQIVRSHNHEYLHTCQTCVSNLEKAVNLYRGDFLDGMYLGNVAGFQEWIVFNRERHFHGMIEMLKTLSKVYYRKGNYDQAYWYAWRYVDLAPLEEGAYRLLMRLLTLSGRRNAALQQYEYCKTIINRELGIDPSPETRQLYTLIKNGHPIETIDTGKLSMGGEDPPPTIGIKVQDQNTPLYDPVTEIPMGPIFMDRLKRAILRMHRSQLMVAVMVITVDHEYQLGQPDDIKAQLDQFIARRLVGTIRECDTVALISENKFALILEELNDTLVIGKIIKKIERGVGAQINIQKKLYNIKIHIGSSIYPRDGKDAIELLNKAEIDNRNTKARQPTLF